MASLKIEQMRKRAAPHDHFAQLRGHWAFIGFLMR
jgi:hypothetical protein